MREGRKVPSFPSHCLNLSVKLNNTICLNCFTLNVFFPNTDSFSSLSIATFFFNKQINTNYQWYYYAMIPPPPPPPPMHNKYVLVVALPLGGLFQLLSGLDKKLFGQVDAKIPPILASPSQLLSPACCPSLLL